MFDFDMFLDAGEGFFPLPEKKGCGGNGNGNGNGSGGTDVYPDERMTLAMGYVPEQEFDDVYTEYSEALANGSLFSSLVKPFYGGKGER